MASRASLQEPSEQNATGAPSLPEIQLSSQNNNPSATLRQSTSYTTTPSSAAISRNASTGTVQKLRGGSSTGALYPTGQQKYFKSRRIKKGEIERPWLDHKDPREKWVTIIPIVGLVLGLMVSAALIWLGIRSVITHNYCQVLDDDFSFWDDSVWTKEMEVGGYGNGQFEMTTNTDENVYVENNMLIIKPTLQVLSMIENNYILDLRGHGCTGSKWHDCLIATNTTNGTIINPVKSGRINTRRGVSIKYGRVEVEAKLPAGDWLWPAIWMLPKDNVYGEWPRSGEIDILESRGNNYTYAQGGNNIVGSTLHFGPNSANDGWWRTNARKKALHTSYAAGWHTFGLEWSEKYIYTYIDTRLSQVMWTHFDEPFFEYGKFPLTDSNGTRLVNPWQHTGSKASPFDEDFYLVINLAVGGTNGWFEDGKSNKPWVDTSPFAMREFWAARDSWWPTWQGQGSKKGEEGALKIRRVRMWQQGGWKGCPRKGS